ncbi:ABCC2 [Symbiodinium sp. CCMP2592]|nr:ABCC2 [Symbiodinium sp. CCMP2592]
MAWRSCRLKERIARCVNVDHLEPEEEQGKGILKAKTTVLSMGQPAKVGCCATFRAVFSLYLPYFLDRKTRCRAWVLMLVVAACLVASTALSVRITEVNGAMENIIVAKEVDEFWAIFWNFILLNFLKVPLIMVKLGSHILLRMDWRRYLTRRMLQLYVSESSGFYRLSMQYGNVDNPDERIAQNIGTFTEASLNLTVSLLDDLLTIMANCTKLFAISPMLFYILTAMSVLYTGLMLGLFAGPLMRVQRRVLAVEASLRYCLMRIRESAESKVLDYAIWAEYKRTGIQILYEAASNLLDMGTEVIPMCVLFPLWFQGELDFGTVGQANQFFQNTMGGMMDLGSQLETISQLGADTIRIKELWDALQKIEEESKDSDSKSEASTQTDPDSEDYSEIEGLDSSDETELDLPEEKLHIEDIDPVTSTLRLQVSEVSDAQNSKIVTLFPPLGNAPLMEGLSFDLYGGQSLLIEGASGSGKSSLLRAIAGLWISGRGKIRRTKIERCFFVPQTPYLCLGSLRDNLLYPRREGVEEPSTTLIFEVLSKLKIDHLPKRLGMDEEVDLQKILSGGERQRLNLARLLLQPNVDLAIMDESTAALDEENERTAYELVQNHVGCYISVGHRPGLVACHTHRLQLVKTSRDVCRGVLSEVRAEGLRLLAAAASTCRGQCGSEADRQGALQLVKAMEALNPTPEPTKGLLEGKWRLIFASEDVTRSSPFFWGWRRMLEGIPDPSPLSRALFNTEELSESIFAFTDGIPLKNIGEATQTLYNGQIVNRVAVEIWGLGTTVMTTTCRYMPAEDPSELLLTVETTQAVDNTLPLADQVVFPSETFLGDNARLRARVTYLDEDLRIFRNELDDQVFVYVRA